MWHTLTTGKKLCKEVGGGDGRERVSNLLCFETILEKTINTHGLHTVSPFLEQYATYYMADSLAFPPAQTGLVMAGSQKNGCLLALAGPF